MKRIITLLVLLLSIGVYSQNYTTQLMKASDLEKLTLEELGLLRNEILARKGYSFSSPKYLSYFETQSWYRPLQSNNSVVLSDIDNENIALIQSYEAKERRKREYVIRDLKEIRKGVNTGDKQILEKFLVNGGSGTVEDLKKLFKYCLLEDINWNRKKGFYKVVVDDGYEKSFYQISIEKDKARLDYGLISHSDNFGDFADGYSDYDSTFEYQGWIIFKVTEAGLVFEKYDLAG